MKHEYEAMTKW